MNEISIPEIQLCVAQDGTAEADVGNPTLEILVDGSDILNRSVGSDVLEISVRFEKNSDEEGCQNELVNHLDGVEVRVSLDSTQTVGVEVVSSHQGDGESLQIEDVLLHSEGPEDDTETRSLPVENLLPLCDAVAESDHAMLDCDAGNEIQSGDKKRLREGHEETGRCLKLKTVEGKTGELEEVHSERVEPAASLSGQCVDRVTPISGMGFEGNASENRNACKDVAILGDEELGTVCKAPNDILGNNGNGDIAIEPTIADKVCSEAITLDEGTRVRPPKKRKIAMLLAYCGAGYQGMQKNPGAVTIEGELEEALTKAGAMPDNYDGNPRKVDWMRAARTDKGVSAVGQVVSGSFYVDPPGFVERVNTHLPKQIRLLGYKRVTPTFSAKKFCDRRRYEYVIPAFALNPTTHRDREAVLASEGTESAFVKCLECSERGRKVPAGKSFDKSLPGKVDITVVDSFDGKNAFTESPCTQEMTDDKVALSTALVGEACTGSRGPTDSEVTDLPSLQKQTFAEEGLSDDVAEPIKVTRFQFGETERVKLNLILNHYVGTHNFHNFTSRVKAEDPSAKRYIVSFEAGDVFTVRNTEFVKCTVVGQSFMLHQIRKMIGLAIAVFRGCVPESVLDMALRRDAQITIPTAPELGLFLDECMYPAYNQKWYNTHEEVSQKGYEEEISCFKHDVIYEHIAATEQKEGQMALFLHSLNDRNYADFATAREADKQLI